MSRKPFLSILERLYWSSVIKCDIEEDSRWERRDSKKRTKKYFTSDNRKSVRWLQQKAGDKAKEIQKARHQKEKEEWLLWVMRDES